MSRSWRSNMTSLSTPRKKPVPLEDITCRLCQQPFSSPKLLSCLHSFCQLCIEERLTTEGGGHVFQCPLCKHKTRLQTLSASSLTTNYYILGRQRVYACRTSKASNCVVCSLKGDSNEATRHCLDCGDRLCERCSTRHNSSTLTATHRVVSLSEIKDGRLDRHLLQRVEPICEKHCECLVIFCKTCSGAFCVKCVVAEHSEHQFEMMDKTVAKVRQSLKQTLSKVTSSSQDSVKILQAEMDQLNKEEEMFVSELTSSVAAVMEKISEKSSEVLEKGRRSFKEERTRKQRMLELVNSESERRKEFVRVCQQLEGSDEITFLLMSKTINEGLKEITKLKQFAADNVSAKEPLKKFKIDVAVSLDDKFLTLREVPLTRDHISLPIGVNVSRTLNPGSDKGSEDLQKVNSMKPLSPRIASEKVDARTHLPEVGTESSEDHLQKHDRHPQTSRPITIDHHDNAYEGPSALKQELEEDTSCDKEIEIIGGVDNVKQYIQYKRQFSLQTGTDGSQTGLSCMAQRSNGTLIVLDEQNTKLKVFETNGNFVYSVFQKGKCQLFKQFVHVGDGDKIFAIYENNLLILTRHLKNLSTHPLLRKEAMTCEPIVANFGGNILIGNLPDREMRVMTTSGKMVRKWTSQVTGEMASLKHVVDNAVISCTWQGKGSVCMESEENGCLLKINGQKRNGIKWRPSSAVFSTKGRTIVSDMHRNDILIFSPSGEALCVVDTLQNRVSEPNCLVLGNDVDLYVSCKDGVIAVYKLL
ncbi:E3 ubiquitin-protein ligase TRIM56-like [Haliotis asinina]|uniref:E3 ubiquitin-protein ligase TRIM56-like n=1 Tax=Haliotis asinina TaxID=109174 RepID=UPI0035324E44